MKYALDSKIMARLNSLPQAPPDEDGDNELIIGKNDPKNGMDDHWWAAYGSVHISGYYSLRQLLIDLDHEISKAGYYDKLEEL